MKNKSIFLFEIFTILFFILNIFFLKISNYYVIAAFVIGFSLILVKFIGAGFDKRDFRYLKDVLLSVVNFSIVYLLIYYSLGFVFGFLKSGYSLRLDIIIRNIFPIIVIIVSGEILRFSLNNKIKDNLFLIILSLIIFILIDVNLNIYLYNYGNELNYIYMFINCVFPSFFKNILLTYISFKVGYKPNIVYRFIIELPIYFISIVPDIPSYINILLGIFFNWGLFMYLFRLYTKDKFVSPKQRRRYIIPSIVMIMFMFLTIYLCCGYFTYSVIAVGSGSMEKEIYKGDAIILKKINISSLKVGDVLVFEKNGKKVVHRIAKINRENDSYFIKTKGDNNNFIDNWTVTNDEVIGVVKFKIRYLGYPTIWVSELIK